MNLLNKKFKEKDYSYCIYLLNNEINDILTNKIKKFNTSFSYTNLDDLKLNCIKYLDYDTAINVIDYYNISIHKNSNISKMNKLLDIYKNLK